MPPHSRSDPCLAATLGTRAGVFLATGWREQRAAAPEGFPTNAVAVVGTQVITLESFQRELARRGPVASGKAAEVREKQGLLEEMIRFEVLYQKALTAGYGEDPQITASLRRMIVAKFQENQLAKLGSAPVSAEEIAQFYQANPERFGTPERVRAALIELKVARTATAEQRAVAATRAAAVLAEARTNMSPDRTFGAVALKHSEHQASRYRGGDIGWLTGGITNEAWPSAVLEALFTLSQPGEISSVIETPTAFYLVRLVEKHPAKLRSLEEVKDGVAYLISRQKAQQQQEQLYSALKQGLSVEINQVLLDSVPVSAKASQPPGVPGGSSAPAQSQARQ